MWFESTTGTLHYYTEADSNVLNAYSKCLFLFYNKLKEITLDEFDASKMEDATGLFSGNQELILLQSVKKEYYYDELTDDEINELISNKTESKSKAVDTWDNNNTFLYMAILAVAAISAVITLFEIKKLED